MRLSRFTHYAFRLLIAVGSQPNRRHTVQQVAADLGVSRNQLMKVTHRLAQTGLLAASRGRRGGLVLARPASRILVGEIIRAAEDDLVLLGEGDRGMASGPLGRALEDALGAFLARADAYSLADLIVAVEVSGPDSPPPASAAQGLQPRDIGHLDAPRIGDDDRSHPLEPGQLAGDGLNGKTQKIRDVEARQRQIEGG